ncbi:MAG: HdeD family acid-resistance protein [Alphaproteobacteria bacterium]
MYLTFVSRAFDGWKALLLCGALAILFGVIALFLPDMTLAALMAVFALCLAFGGTFAILAGRRIARRGGRAMAFYLEGALAIAVAALAVIWPDQTIAAIITLIGIWALLTGGFLLFAARPFLADTPRQWLSALPGALSMAFGLVLILWPSIAAVAFSWWLGLFAIAFGALLAGLALRMKNRNRLANLP